MRNRKVWNWPDLPLNGNKVEKIVGPFQANQTRNKRDNGSLIVNNGLWVKHLLIHETWSFSIRYHKKPKSRSRRMKNQADISASLSDTFWFTVLLKYELCLLNKCLCPAVIIRIMKYVGEKINVTNLNIAHTQIFVTSPTSSCGGGSMRQPRQNCALPRSAWKTSLRR